jgi:hypothetical protein
MKARGSSSSSSKDHGLRFFSSQFFLLRAANCLNELTFFLGGPVVVAAGGLAKSITRTMLALQAGLQVPSAH